MSHTRKDVGQSLGDLKTHLRTTHGQSKEYLEYDLDRLSLMHDLLHADDRTSNPDEFEDIMRDLDDPEERR